MRESLEAKNTTGIRPGDFATGHISGYEFTNKEDLTEEGPVREIIFEENSTRVVIEVDKSDEHPLLSEKRTITSKYKFEFRHIAEVECLCGNKKLFSSESEKWFCPWCDND